MGEWTKTIAGIPVKFPYENPYGIQISYMEQIIESLKEKRHAILESPTGTGKTLCLLCATLGWISKEKEEKTKFISDLLDDTDDQEMEEEEETQKGNGNNILSDTNGMLEGTSGLPMDMAEEEIPMHVIPQVIFASRTHSQISQAMNELKNSPYKDIRAAVFASRAQLCINPNVKGNSNTNIIYKCRSLTKNNGCEYKNNVIQSLNEPLFEKPILDIEDLCNAGKVFKCCPYFASKKLRERADIVFLPYNYLLDPKIRDNGSIDLKNAIVILDEAHNVEKICEQSACASINTSDLANANNELNHILDIFDEMESFEENGNGRIFRREDVNKLQSSLFTLEGIMIANANSTNGNLQQGGHLFELFKQAEITNGNYKMCTKLMNDLIEFLCDQSEDAKGLKKTSEFLTVAFSGSIGELKNKVNTCCKIQFKNDGDFMNSKTLNFWCFSPALGMKPLLDSGIRCLIMTSGTLEPLDELETEMEIPSPIKLKNPHIIDQSQVFVNIVSKGHDGTKFDASFSKRENPEYLRSLGDSIVKLCDSITGGLLIFFASYPVMQLCQNFWKDRGIWSKMEAKRHIYCETKNESSDVLKSTMNSYYNSIEKENGAIFMAVLRGKVSEGVDFTDMYGRATIIIGVPFAPFRDIKITSKMTYMDGKQVWGKKMLSGSEWYRLDAIRAVNQAIGRVIRHKNDYGAILLCDCRFNEERLKQYLSTWVMKILNSRNSVNFRTMTEQLEVFFTHCEKTLPKPKSKSKAPVLDLRDEDDESDDANVYRDSNEFYAADSEDEDTYESDFINDSSLDERYSSSSSFETKRKRKSNKRKKRSPKKRAINGGKRSNTSQKRKMEKESNGSVTELSEEQNTDDERFIDDGDSTDDDAFLNDESLDERYSSSSSFEGVITQTREKGPTTRSKTRQNRKTQPLKRHSMKSPQPSTSTSYQLWNRCNNDESNNESSSSSSQSDESMSKIKRGKNGKNFKRIIIPSDSESEDSESSHANSILACFKQDMSSDQYKRFVDAFNEYNNNNGSYESYRDTLFEIFNGADDLPNLMGILLFLKFQDQSKFDEDIQRKYAE